jgi:methylated-DNA-[protein]-cysteine S-methyltransferase
VELAYEDRDTDALLAELSTKLSPRLLEAPAQFDDVRRQLDEYFEGKRTRFDTPIDWSLSSGFTQRILQATAKVPFGQLATYREMAGKAGNERAVRAAGNALGSNHIPIIVPCHRIIRTGGALGGYTGGLERKEFLLKLEGIILA